MIPNQIFILHIKTVYSDFNILKFCSFFIYFIRKCHCCVTIIIWWCSCSYKYRNVDFSISLIRIITLKIILAKMEGKKIIFYIFTCQRSEQALSLSICLNDCRLENSILLLFIIIIKYVHVELELCMSFL